MSTVKPYWHRRTGGWFLDSAFDAQMNTLAQAEDEKRLREFDRESDAEAQAEDARSFLPLGDDFPEPHMTVPDLLMAVGIVGAFVLFLFLGPWR